jgi:hypothetical protein
MEQEIVGGRVRLLGQPIGYEVVQSKEICVIPRKDLVTPQRGCPEMVDTQPSAENGDAAKSNNLERNLPLSR